MIKKPITYMDLDGNWLTEDFYFSLSKAELAQLELSYQGGLSVYLKSMVADNDGGKIMKAVEEIILLTIGQRAPNGKAFLKSDEIKQEFRYSDAYSELFISLVTEAGAAAEFINGVVPADLAEQMEALNLKADVVELPKVHTEAELLAMTDDEFDLAAGSDFRKMTKVQQLVAFKRKSA